MVHKHVNSTLYFLYFPKHVTNTWFDVSWHECEETYQYRCDSANLLRNAEFWEGCKSHAIHTHVLSIISVFVQIIVFYMKCEISFLLYGVQLIY